MYQDWFYFLINYDSMIVGIVYVSDVIDEMGCLWVYFGFYKFGWIEGVDGCWKNDMFDFYLIENVILVECQVGDVVFFYYFMFYGFMLNWFQVMCKMVLC